MNTKIETVKIELSPDMAWILTEILSRLVDGKRLNQDLKSQALALYDEVLKARS